ncbi:MAG: ATP-binding protein [Bacteroidota bacterium]
MDSHVVPRLLTNKIKQFVRQYPIVALTGPRQSGKTTILRAMFEGYRYLSLEDISVREFAENDPIGFLKQYDDKVIFDEAQRVPSLFPYLQVSVDKSRKLGQYILSGFQNFHMMERITQSLAGRVAITRLLPFDAKELKAADLFEENWMEMAFKGFYPAIYDRNLSPREFYNSYLSTYIDRDVSDLRNIHDFRAFRTLLGLLAGRVGQLINYSDLAKSIGVSQPTVKAWIAVLERSYIVYTLPPYFENFSQRLIKRPKIYFYDTGLLCFLLGVMDPEAIQASNLRGPIFENLCVAELLKRNEHEYTLLDFYFWRNSSGKEIDLLHLLNGGLSIYEVKSTSTRSTKIMKGLQFFSELAKGQVKQKTILYGGSESEVWNDVQFRPWWA